MKKISVYIFTILILELYFLAVFFLWQGGPAGAENFFHIDFLRLAGRLCLLWLMIFAGMFLIEKLSKWFLKTDGLFCFLIAALIPAFASVAVVFGSGYGGKAYFTAMWFLWISLPVIIIRFILFFIAKTWATRKKTLKTGSKTG